MNELDVGLLGRRRVRPIRQTELTECGLACLAMVASYHGLDVDLPLLRKRFGAIQRGTSLKGLMDIADRLGFLSRPVRVDLKDLGDLRLPAVLHWDMRHFVVLEKVRGGRALVHDPDGRSGWMPLRRISDHFTGVALELERAGHFAPADLRRRLRLRQLWSGLEGAHRAAAQVVALTIAMQVLTLALPYLVQLALDLALPAEDTGLLLALGAGFAALAILGGAVSLLRSAVLTSAGSSIGYGITANIARRLFRLPVDWFERRQVGDILSRFQSVQPVRAAITEQMIAGMLDALMASATLALMLLYSAVLGCISLAAAVALIGLRMMLVPRQRMLQEEAVLASGKEQTILIESVRGIRTLRLFGKEQLRHSLWLNRLTASVNATIRHQRVTNLLNVATTTANQLEYVLIVCLAVASVIRGQMTVGMIVAFLAYRAQFQAAAGSVTEKLAAVRVTQVHIDRLGDIVLAEEDGCFSEASQGDALLDGDLELRSVSFSYGPDEPMVLSDLDLVIDRGEAVAITGPSGSGKSTLVRLLLGLVEPSSGSVLVDGHRLDAFGRRNFQRQVAAVMQDDALFGGSIKDNISMFDEDVDLGAVIRAAATACVAEDIDRMPLRYDTLVGDMGNALSGGQAQRILLARALYRRPRLMIMDEATSHLDVERERRIAQSISAMGITRIIIAHRQETIASADRVLSLEGGRLVEIASRALSRSPSSSGTAFN